MIEFDYFVYAFFNLNSVSRKTRQTTKMETAVSSETVVQSYIPEGTAQHGVEF